MKDSKALLSEGIEILCKGDEGINFLIAPNKEKIITTLCAYINEIETFNPAYGLVGTTDSDELVIKHILDSLAPLGIIWKILPRTTQTTQTTRTNTNEENRNISASSEPSVRCPCEPLRAEIADAGSGAGLPGIPLAISLPEYSFTLIERMGRRAGFLLNTKAALEISNVNIEESELKKCASPLAAQFDLITFRAFKPLEPKLFKTLRKICRQDGMIAAYRGRREKTEAEMADLAVQLKEAIEWEVIPCSVPFLDEERHLAVIKFRGSPKKENQ